MDDIFANHLKDLSNKSRRSGKYIFTDFLNLDEQNTLNCIKRELTAFDTYGGTDGCERIMVRFIPDDDPGYEVHFPLKCIKVSPLQQKFADVLSHRDILGAVMNLGIERSCIGDIVLFENVAYMFTVDRIAQFICNDLIRIKHTSVQCECTEDLPTKALFNTEEQRITVTSLRVDCIVSGVFNLSRSSTEKLIVAQKIFIDGKCCQTGSQILKDGNTVSVRGFGRFIFKEHISNTKKGRLVIMISKYL